MATELDWFERFARSTIERKAVGPEVQVESEATAPLHP